MKMGTLEEEELINQFVIAQNFLSADGMLSYAASLKEIHLQENCEICENNIEKIECGTATDKDYPECVNISLQPDDESGAGHRAALPSYTGNLSEKIRDRKSRKSVCVPTLRYSSSESDIDENEDPSDEEMCDDSNSISNDEVFLKGKQRNIDKSSSRTFRDQDDEDEKSIENSTNGEDNVVIDPDDNFDGCPIPYLNTNSKEDTDSDCSPVLGKKRNICRIGSSSDESDDNTNSSDESDNDNTKTKNIRRISISSDQSDCDTNSSHTLSSDSRSSTDEASGHNGSVSDIIHSIKKLDVRSSDSSSDDDFEDDRKSKPKKYEKTPLATPKPKHPLSKKATNVMTPNSSIRRILNTFPTPSSVPGTPAYKRHFNSKREGIVKELFILYNETVFDNRLPKDLGIIWNKRMTKTAGFCYSLRTGAIRSSRIELSDKVIDSVERIRDTLIHELCHAATWIFEGKRGHGLEWKYWAKKANRIHTDLPVVTTCHNYEIQTRYKFQCDGCGHVFGRHTKSINPDKHRCGTCGGRPLLLSDNVSTSATPKLNVYASYVKENFSSVKKANPSLSSKELMKKIAEDYRTSKKDKDKDKENIGYVS